MTTERQEAQTDVLGNEEKGGDPLAGLLTKPVALRPAEEHVPVPVKPPMPLPPIPRSALGENGERIVADALERLPVESLDLTAVIRLGLDVQRELGGHIDGLLDQVKKKNSPVLFELFKRLAEGVEEANLAELEEKIKEGDKPGMLGALSEWIGWSKAEDRAQEFVEDLRKSLTGKSDTLLELVRGMESQAMGEVQGLVLSLGQLDTMGKAYLGSVRNFAIVTEIGYKLLERAEARRQELLQRAAESQDPQHVSEAHDFGLLTEQLRNRVLTLRSAYERIPAELAIISTAKEAASTTLAETANGIQQEFNDIKSALMKWHVLLNLRDTQALNDKRREIAQQLSRHGLVVLEQVAIHAASEQGKNRLEDAQTLLAIGNGLKQIRTKVEAIETTRKQQFLQAEGALAEARQVFSALPAPSAQPSLTVEPAKG